MKIKVLILPKFDSDDFTGDSAGEARLFYDAYFKNSDVYTLRNGKKLYYDPARQIAMGLCSVGKVGAASYLSTLLCDSHFDFSETYVLNVGCGGSAAGYSTMGDVCVVSEIVDYDLGFETVSSDPAEIKWFYDDIFRDSSRIVLNRKLVDFVIENTKDIEIGTTDITRRIMHRNFPGEEWAERDPRVITGTSMTSDTFWKGEAGHKKALYLNDFYKCRDPFAMTEMEDIACATVASQFGLLDRFIDLRVSVNLDVFKDGETPESIWTDDSSYIDRINQTNDETLDIFPIAMQNLFKVGSRIIGFILK